MAKLAVFPKAWLDALCVDGTMTLAEWIDLSARFKVDGLEFYAGFQELADRRRWSEFRRRVEDQGREIPMLCCSPDFTHPDPAFRQRQIDLERHWIDLTAELGGRFCRVLSGQRRPGVRWEDAMNYVVEAIESCREHAVARGVTLILENHYKDGYWEFPEFAQRMPDFVELVERIEPGPGFEVNFDPSNCLICGEDPLELLERVKDRVVTMHASDRHLEGGTLEDLRRLDQAGTMGYAKILKHGAIGEGMNDYDRIFAILREVDFDGWISIEDGDNPAISVGEIERSVAFLRAKMETYLPSRKKEVGQ
jgi:sugar phosphate isomerase/epimerase